MDNVNINESLGILFDSIFYTCIHFCKKEVVFRFQTLVQQNEDTILYHYNTFRDSKQSIDPPASLFSLFYYDKSGSCVLMDYFITHIDFFQDSVEDFLQKISNKRDFKVYVFEYYFAKYKDTIDMDKLLHLDGETVAKALALISETVDITSFIYMIYHFSDLVNELANYINELIPLIKAYHKKNRSHIDEVVKAFINNETLQLKKRFVGDDFVNLTKQTYSVSLLARYIIVKRTTNGHHPYAFLLGCESIALLSQAIDYRYVTIESTIKTFGNELKLEILKELSSQDRTISQLSRILHIARSSIGHCIDDLLHEVAIIKVKKSGVEIYYRLNAKYFYRAQKTFACFIDELMLALQKNS